MTDLFCNYQLSEPSRRICDESCSHHEMYGGLDDGNYCPFWSDAPFYTQKNDDQPIPPVRTIAENEKEKLINQLPKVSDGQWHFILN